MRNVSALRDWAEAVRFLGSGRFPGLQGFANYCRDQSVPQFEWKDKVFGGVLL